MKKRIKRAQIVAFTIEVCCPECGAAQPNPDNGAFPWTPTEMRAEAAKEPMRTCVECDEPFKLVSESSAAIEPDVDPLPATDPAEVEVSS